MPRPENAASTCCAGGLVPYWAKDLKVGFSNINAKAEGIENRPAFRDAFQRRRCLVPVDNFYEWKTIPTGKQPYAIALADEALSVSGTELQPQVICGSVRAPSSRCRIDATDSQ
jgi:putative SOS response-associated peptidase YedK